MVSPENILETLAGQLAAIGRNNATGTLTVTSSDGRTKQFLFRQGSLADMDTGREDTVLEAALASTGAVTEKDVKRAKKSAARSGQSVGAEMLELQSLPEAELAASIRSRLVEEFCESFQWNPATVELIEHGPELTLEGFRSDLSEFFDVSVDAEEILVEASSRVSRWDLIVEHVSMLGDVMYATPTSFRYFREQDHYPAEHSVLSTVDGIKDVEEVIAECGRDPFEALALVRTLQAQGDLELINPVQMYQLGVECMNSSRFEKAVKLLRRAHERGLDDFDLQLKLAQSLDALRRHGEAIAKYLEFSEKCIQQLRFEDAIRTLRRVVKMDPTRMEVQELLFEVLLEQRLAADAVEQGLILAARKAEAGDPRGGLDALRKVQTLAPQDTKLLQKVIELAEACGDRTAARAEREALAKSFDERKDVELALETYQRMFCDGNDSLDVRLKLVHLHRQRGNRQKALDHINALLGLPEKQKVKDEKLLEQLHEMVRELKPSDIRSNRWLADHYSKTNEKEKAANVLKSWIGYLETEGDFAEVARAYEQLISIVDSSEHRWGLVRVLERLGKSVECRREIRSLANISLRKRDFEQAAKAVDHVLKSAPLDIETRKLQVELLEAQDQTALAARRHEELAVLYVLSGDVQEAEQSCRRLTEGSPELAESVRRLGRLCGDMGDRQKAAEQTIKAAKLHLQHKNLGLCQAALDQLFALEPAHAEGKALQAELRAREAPPPPPEKEKPAPVVVASPPPPEPQAAPVEAKAAPEPCSPALAWPVEREPFQDSKPVRASNVSNIMNRLKRLKSGALVGSGSPSEKGPAAAPQDAPASVAPPPAAAAAAPIAPAAESSQGAGVATALKSAASRLKALAGKKAQQASSAALSSAEAPAAPPAPAPSVASAPPASPVATESPAVSPAAPSSPTAPPEPTFDFSALDNMPEPVRYAPDGSVIGSAPAAPAPTPAAPAGDGAALAPPASLASASPPAPQGLSDGAKKAKVGNAASRLAALKKVAQS